MQFIEGARVRRTGDLPHFAIHNDMKCTKEIPLPCHEFKINYSLSRRTNLGHDFDDAIKQREFFGWLMKDKLRVGAFYLKEYFAENCSNNDEFLELMDRDEQYEHCLSTALCAGWDDIISDVAEYGSILDFRNAWISPAVSRPNLLVTAGNTILTKIFSKYAILIMKAFPLEYESNVEGHEEHFSRRQRAMTRYYQHGFRVSPLPGWPGEEGYLWRSNPKFSDFIIAPQIKAEKHKSR